MINIILKSICRYLIIAGVLGVLGFTIPIYYSIMILIGFIGVELNTDNESFTAIYLNTEPDEE